MLASRCPGKHELAPTSGPLHLLPLLALPFCGCLFGIIQVLLPKVPPQPFSIASPCLRAYSDCAYFCVSTFPVLLPLLVGSSSKAGTWFCVPSCPQLLKECLAHSRLSPSVGQALNQDKPPQSPPWQGLYCRRISRKLLGQSLGEWGGAGPIRESPGWHSSLPSFLLSGLWLRVGSGETSVSGGLPPSRGGCTGSRGGEAH